MVPFERLHKHHPSNSEVNEEEIHVSTGLYEFGHILGS